MRCCLSLLLALSSGCGAKTQLDEGVGDERLADGGTSTLPDPRALDTWHYATIRAVCDLFVVRFCDADHAVVSVQYDGCDTPLEPSSVSYDVRWETPTRFRLSLRGDAPPPGVSPNLLFEYNTDDDSLTWIDPSPPFEPGFPIESGRGTGLGPPGGPSPGDSPFVMCP